VAAPSGYGQAVMHEAATLREKKNTITRMKVQTRNGAR
jgi:hypothetical protein